MSGQRVILLMALGLLLVASVTLALYFLTRKDEDEPPVSTSFQPQPIISMTIHTLSY
jgi:hypothetical protein